MAEIIINESQFKLISGEVKSNKKLKEAEAKWDKFTKEQKEFVIEMLKVSYPKKSKLIKEHWLNTLGDIVGIFDPTGVVDLINGVSYFIQGHWIFGTLSMISALPFVGDIVAKPVTAALKIGGDAAKGLKTAETLAKAGKTAEASAQLAKVSEAPGVIGGFVRKASEWAPNLISKVEKLPGGVVKGFKNTIIDWLTLLSRAGSKSTKFAAEAGKLAKMSKINPAKQLENIKVLQDMLKNEKIWQSTGVLKAGAEGLTKKGVLAQTFLGGAPRLFGDRRMRILMRQTKFWLGFLDFIGIGNFTGPEELSSKMGEGKVQSLLQQYSKTPQAEQYAKEDFPDISQKEVTAAPTQQITQQQPSQQSPLSGLFGNLFSNQMGKAALLAV